MKKVPEKVPIKGDALHGASALYTHTCVSFLDSIIQGVPRCTKFSQAFESVLGLGCYSTMQTKKLGSVFLIYNYEYTQFPTCGNSLFGCVYHMIMKFWNLRMNRQITYPAK